MPTYQDVKRAVSEWMIANDHIGTAADLGYRLAADFGISEQRRAAHVTFQNQVRRALTQLTNDGVLVRDYEGEPDYRTLGYDARRREANRLAAEDAQRLREAWDRVHSRIRALGIDGKMAGPVISLDLDSWDELLSYAEKWRQS